MTKIQWTNATWNSWAGCAVVSPGCTNCYAMRRVAPRLAGNPVTPHYAGTVKPTKAGHVWTGEVHRASEAKFTEPLRWRASRMVFVNSTSDFWYAPAEWRADALAIMQRCPQHVFQILTKRPELITEDLPGERLVRRLGRGPGTARPDRSPAPGAGERAVPVL